MDTPTYRLALGRGRVWAWRLLRWLWRQAQRLHDLHGIFTSELVRPILAPAFALMTAALGILQGGIPLMWIAVGAALSFAAVSSGLLRFDEWLERTDPRNKLVVRAPKIVASTLTYGDNLKWVQIEFNVKNVATFSIEYQVLELRAIFDDRVTGSAGDGIMMLVPPGEYKSYRGDVLNTDGIKLGSHKAQVEYEILYGRPEGRKLSVRGQIQVDILASPGQDGFTTAWSVTEV